MYPLALLALTDLDPCERLRGCVSKFSTRQYAFSQNRDLKQIVTELR